MKGITSIMILLLFSCSLPPVIDEIPAGKVIISKVVRNTSLTIKNDSKESVNLINWKLLEVRQSIFGDKDTNSFVIPSVILNSGSSTTYSAATMGFVLSSEETVYLFNNEGTLISQMYWIFFE